MCSLVQVELCVYCPVAGDELTLSVLCDLTLQVNLFSRNVIYWLPQFTQKYNGMFLNSHKSRCGRCSIMLHVNCKIAVFQERSSTYHGKDGHKGYNPGLNKYLHCSVDLEMVLRAQELAPSGIMLVILS